MNTAAGGHSAAILYEAAKLPCACDPGLRAAWPGAKVAGPAFTVRGIGGDNLALHNAVLAAPAGSVLVVDLQGAAYGHWGEVLAVAAQHRGILGLVVDGGVRDSEEMGAMDFPVFSRHVTVVGTVKDYPGDMRSAVRVGGLVVHTGDLVVGDADDQVVGDADGVVVLPQNSADAVISRADQRVADEQQIIADIRAGKTTLELYGLNAEGTFTAR